MVLIPLFLPIVYTKYITLLFAVQLKNFENFPLYSHILIFSSFYLLVASIMPVGYSLVIWLY